MDGRLSFWGVEVKPKDVLLVDPTEDADYVHLSQVALGATAKDGERVVVQLKEEADEDDDEDEPAPVSIVLGTLSKGKVDQMALDLVLDRPFTLQHSGSHSIFFAGYKTRDVGDDDDFDMEGPDGFDEEDISEDEEEEDDEEEEAPVPQPKSLTKAEKKAAAKAAAKDTEMKEAPAAETTPKGQKRPAQPAEATPSPALSKSQLKKQKKAAAAQGGASPAEPAKAEAKPAAKEAAKPAPKTPTPAAKPAAAPSTPATAPSPGQTTTPGSKKKAIFPCTKCAKKFGSEEFLDMHMKNKHA